MLTISNKGKLMPESPIRKLVPFAEKAKQKGIDIYPPVLIIELKLLNLRYL